MNDTTTSTQSSGSLAPQGTANPAFDASKVSGPGSLDPTLNAAPPVSQTQDASAMNAQISNNTQGVVFPQAPGAPTGGTTANAGIPTPIASASDILSQGTQATPAESTNTSLLQKVAQLIGSKTGQTTMTNSAESAAGVPSMQKTVNDLSVKLQGLNDQATKLQQDAGAGGLIQNQEQNAAQGRGITSGGLAPLTAADLRNNQVQQAAIASQALTVKAALYGAQGNLALAKDAADKAATAQYEQQQNQIDYQNALIAANLPSMNKQEKAQAALVQQNLQDRQTQIDQAKADKTTIVGWAVAAMKNNPNDPAAHYAAQQALELSNQQRPDLQKALGLVGQYQTDPLATAKAALDLANARKAGIAADQATAVNNANNTDIPTTIANISNPNQPSPALGGLTVNGLNQKAQAYLTNGGNIQGLGLSNSGSAGSQRVLIMNYAGYLADKMGMTVPQITAAYKANSKAASTIITRTAKIETTSATLTNQFPRLIQLANQVGNVGIQESDLTAAKAAGFRKMGNVAAANYIELVQTIRQDYSSMQASIAGSQGAQYFSQSADKAIPVGLSADQYQGIAQTILQSAALAQQAGGTEANALIMGGTNPGVGSGATVKVKSPSGQTGSIPVDQLTAALKAGYSQI